MMITKSYWGKDPKFSSLPLPHFSTAVPCAPVYILNMWHEHPTFQAHEVVMRKVLSLFCYRWL